MCGLQESESNIRNRNKLQVLKDPNTRMRPEKLNQKRKTQDPSAISYELNEVHEDYEQVDQPQGQGSHQHPGTEKLSPAYYENVGVCDDNLQNAATYDSLANHDKPQQEGPYTTLKSNWDKSQRNIENYSIYTCLELVISIWKSDF